jgi:WD40 repeat protein/tetratricopeptide (TPR) repeat protein
MSQYNVFLSHNSADKAAVEHLARRLNREVKLTPFLDKWHLIPGEPWQEALEFALDNSQTCAVFLGPAGLGAWENEEMRAALEGRVKNPTFRVIPVLLPGSKMPERGELPRFLSRLTWVDFRQGLDEPEAFRLFVAGILGVAPGPSSEAAIFVNEEPPYRGLEKFRPEDAKWFFGRESEIQQLIEKVKNHRFIAILGASGSGKSSVLLGGLVPALKKGVLVGSQDWPIITFTPTDQPVQELAIQLSSLIPSESTSGLLRDLEADERTLHLVVRRALKGAPNTQRVVMIVDQFEEIFTLCKNENSRKQFLSNLLYASGMESSSTLLLLIMRADFLSKCAPYDELADRLAAFQFFITPMVNDQMRQAIEAPAAQAGLGLEPGLADLILDDIADESGALPLLEHALLELWKRRDARTLTFKAYKEIGGATGALTRSADSLYISLNESQKTVLQRILLLMVNPGEGTEDTARRVKQAELVTQSQDQEGVEFVLRRLADERLVTTGQERNTEQVVVSLAHEALIRNWALMQRWINENRESLRIHRRLAEATDEWVRLGRDEGLLYRGARLVQTQEWVEEHAIEMTSIENEFLQASLIARKVEEQEHEENLRRQEQLVAEQHTGKRLRRLVGGLAIVFVIALLTSLFAAQQWAVANQARGELANEVNLRSTAQAAAQNNEAEVIELNRVIQAGELAEASKGALDTFPQQSLLLAIESLRTNDGRFQAGEQALRDALSRVGGIGFSGHDGAINVTELSQDSNILITGGEDGTVRLWDLTSENPINNSRILQSHSEFVTNLAISNDQRWLVTSSAYGDDEAHLWDLRAMESRSKPIVFTFPEEGEMHDGVGAVAISPDNRWLVTAGRYYGAIRLWDLSLADPVDNPIDLLSREDEGVSWVADVEFSSDGRWLASGSQQNHVRLWSLSNKNLFKQIVLDGYQGYSSNNTAIMQIRFSSDNQWLYSVDNYGVVGIWSLEGDSQVGEPVFLMDGSEQSPFEDWRVDLEVSQNNQWLALTSEVMPARLWDLSKREPELQPLILQMGNDEKIRHLAISPDSRWLATGSDWPYNTIRLWDLNSENRAGHSIVLLGHDDAITDLAFSLDGHWLVSASKDGTARVWDFQAHSFTGEPFVYSNLGWKPYSIQVSADRRWLAVGAWNGSIDQRDGEILEILDAAVWLWDLSLKQPNRDPIILPTNSDRIVSLAFSPDGRWLAAGSYPQPPPPTFEEDQLIYLWDLSFPDPARHRIDLSGYPVEEITFSPDNRWLAYRSGGIQSLPAGSYRVTYNARLWDLSSGELTKPVLDLQEEIAKIFFGLNSHALYVMSEQNQLRKWQLTSGIPVESQVTQPDSEVIQIFTWNPVVEVSPRNKWLAARIEQNSVLLFDLALEDPFISPVKLEGSNEVRDVRSLQFSPNEHWLIAGSEWPYGQVWNLNEIQPNDQPVVLSGHRSSVWWVAASNRWAATTSMDETGRLWDLTSTDPAAHPVVLKNAIGPVFLTSDDNLMVSMNREFTEVRMWSLNLDTLVAIACQTAGRNLTVEEWDRYLSPAPYRKTCDEWPADAALFASELNEIETTLNEGDLTQSVKMYDTLLKLNQENNWDVEETLSRQYGQLLLSYAWNQVTLGNIDGAVAAFELAIKYDASLNVDPRLEVGQGNIDTAIAVFELAITYNTSLKIDPHSEVGQTLVETGQSLAKEGNIDGAVAVFELAMSYDTSLEMDPRLDAGHLYAQVLVDKGRSLAEKGKLDEAVAAFELAIEHDSSWRMDPRPEAGRLYAQALVKKGRSLAEKGKLDEAVAAFELAMSYDTSLEMDPRLEAGRTYAPVLGQQGDSLARQGKIDEAIAAFELAMKYDSAGIRAHSWNTLCWFGALWQQASKVLDACEQAVALSDGNANYRDSRGVARAMTGDIEGAIEDFQAFVEANQGKPQAHQRQEWISKLKAGENPFENEELLGELRQS